MTTEQAAKILLVDDEPFVLDALGQLLEAEGYEVFRAATCGDARGFLRTGGDIDAIVSDLKLPDGDALELLNLVKELRPNVPTIVFSGVGTVRHAVDAMKAGALDFLSKPVDPDALLAIVRRAVEHRGLVEEVRRLRAVVGPDEGMPKIVGSSRALREVMNLAKRAAAADARVLLYGESGTGKELLALQIHYSSRRSKRPFIRVNCAAIAEGLFESEMFGHKKGSFTGATDDRVGHFASADGGTLALDEVGTLTSEAQAKLLRVLETGEYAPVGDSRVRRADVRVIAITNEDLRERIKSGTFREDLFFRLNVVPVTLPPLRDRKEDLPELVDYLLLQIVRRDGGARKRVDSKAFEVLKNHEWPGNVRELRNILEQASIFTEGAVIRAETLSGILEGGMLTGSSAAGTLPKEMDTTVAPVAGGGEPQKLTSGIELGDDLTLRIKTEEFQREVIREALARSNGRRSECARLLGIDARNLAYYLRKHGFMAEE